MVAIKEYEQTLSARLISGLLKIHRHIINRGNTVCFDEKVGKHPKG